MKHLLIILSIFLLIGCKVTEEKARKYAYNHKDKLAEWCADCFPVKEIEVKTDSIFTPGKTIIRIDTVQGKCPDGTIIEIPCPPVEEKTPDTIRILNNIKVRDIAQEEVLRNNLAKEQQEHEKTKEKLTEVTDSRDKYRKYFFILLSIIVAFVGLKLFLKFKI